MVKGYKVFNSDWTCSPEGRVKQYTCPGEFEEDIVPISCEQGMHFCRTAVDCFNYYGFYPDNKVAEVVAYGGIAEEGDKCCTNKLKIVREIPWDEVLRLVNQGKNCTGICNTGDKNTGDCNTGDRNTGGYNTGNCNVGYQNTGDKNTGDRNTGHGNAGYKNTGNDNTGHDNTGDNNAGDKNTGYGNAGNKNTGDWNKSSFNNGCFMTIEPKIMMFNKMSNWTYRDWLFSDARALLNQIPQNTVEWVHSHRMTDREKAMRPTHKTTGGCLKVFGESKYNQIWWDKLSDRNKEIIMKIPNFDPKIFKQCTGITV